MGLRRRSIRLKILLLVLVPLVSLIGLYAFVAGITIGDATKAASTPSLRNDAGEPVLKFMQQFEMERRLAALYAARPTQASRQAYRAQQTTTDKFRTAMDAGLKSSTTSGHASTNQKAAIAALQRDSAGLGAIRSEVLSGTLSPLEVVNSYGTVSADIHQFMTRLAQRVSAPVQLQAYSLFQTIASLETLAQEDAIIEAGAASGSLPQADRSQFTELVSVRRQYAEDGERNIGKNVLPFYSRYISPQASDALGALEDTIVDDPQVNGPVPVDPATWGKSVGGVSKGTGALIQAVAIDVSGQGSSVAHGAYLRLWLAGGLGLLALVASVFISIRVGRSLVRQLAALRRSALALATERLPRVMTRLRAGEDVDVSQEAQPMEVTSDEIGQVGQAFNTVQLTAVEAAVDQARLRRGISDVFRNLARRSQSLLHRQLTLLDTMERRTSDPDELADLYRLDHLTTRMRRHAEGLIILSGAAVGRSWRNPVRLVDVLRAAVAEVEDYTRVSVTTMTQAALAGQAVADVIHMVAELVENATLFSPPNTPVRVTGDLVGNGFAVEIEDRGLGMSEEKLVEINHRLANPPEFDLSDSDQLGLFVAGRLARRHGLKISMRTNPFGGSTAIVLIPHNLVVAGEGDAQNAFTKPGDTGAFHATGRQAGGEGAATTSAASSGPSNGRTSRADDGAPAANGATGDKYAGSAPAPTGHRPMPTASANPVPARNEERPPSPPADRPAAPGGDLDPAAPGPDRPATSPGLPILTGQFPPAPAMPMSAANDPFLNPMPAAASDKGGASDNAWHDFATSSAAVPDDAEWAPSDVAPAGPDPAATGPDVTELGLPRRVRQASLAPQLRAGLPHSHAAYEQEVADDRSPEQTRALMTSLQRGWERGRSAPPPAPPRIGPEPGGLSTSGYHEGAPSEGENGGR